MSIKAEHILADAIEAAQDIHPALRRRYQPRNPMGKCRACGQPFLLKDMTEDGLCFEDDARVRNFERGRL